MNMPDLGNTRNVSELPTGDLLGQLMKLSASVDEFDFQYSRSQEDIDFTGLQSIGSRPSKAASEQYAREQRMIAQIGQILGERGDVEETIFALAQNPNLSLDGFEEFAKPYRQAIIDAQLPYYQGFVQGE